MLLIKSESTSPFFNFATEEYFLKNFKEEFFLTSFYDDSISVGINQNTLTEINAMYVKQNSIKVTRRNSGGGTVFHDKGCINYSFIMKDDGSSIDDFHKYCEPILGFLKDRFSLNAQFQSKNDISLDGKKISRMSKFRHNGKFVQHGSLTFSSNLTNFANAIKTVSENPETNGHSIEDLPVANICKSIAEDITPAKFMEMLFSYIKAHYTSAIPYELTKEDYENIYRIAEEKYATWEWNYGKSPDYDYKKVINCPCGVIEVFLKVEQGIIKDVKIYGDFFSEYDISELEDMIKGNRHRCDELLDTLNNIDISKYFGDITNKFFVENLF